MRRVNYRAHGTARLLKCLSEEPISDTRLKQLDRITDSRLLGTVARMRIEKMAGYQEVLTLI